MRPLDQRTPDGVADLVMRPHQSQCRREDVVLHLMPIRVTTVVDHVALCLAQCLSKTSDTTVHCMVCNSTSGRLLGLVPAPPATGVLFDMLYSYGTLHSIARTIAACFLPPSFDKLCSRSTRLLRHALKRAYFRTWV